MKYTKIPKNIQNSLREKLDSYPLLEPLIQAINAAGGKTLLVGGAVRDLFLELPIKDLDIEVHGITLEKLEEILRTFGPVDVVGKIYGVLRVHPFDIDWSIPRSDAAGRKPEVATDPFMNATQAFRRRDLTMNAMGIDLRTFELYDPFGGLQDIEHKVLRTPDATLFIEDPLRFYRVMQFCARFQMEPDDELNKICSRMDVSGVSRERIETEFEKWLLKSEKPSRALDWLNNIGRLKDILPEIAVLQKVRQNPTWHPEGNVYEHTKQALDAAAQLEYANNKEKLIIMYATLCHDLGKATTTEIHNNKITSYGHAQEGVRFAKKLLKRVTRNKELVNAVTKLVRYHMHPLQFMEGGAKLSRYKVLAKKLAPDVTLNMLAKVMLADRLGRNPNKQNPLTGPVEDVEKFLDKARKANVLDKEEKPILLGRDLLDVIPPGQQLGDLLKKAYKIQLQQGITDKQELRRRILEIAEALRDKTVKK